MGEGWKGVEESPNAYGLCTAIGTDWETKLALSSGHNASQD